jgi:stage V sporulation protein B
MLINTILLTATSLLMRSVGMVFQVWLTRKIGAGGIGLFQLIMSVSMLAATFAVSGIRFATTRLVSMDLGMNRGAGATSAVRRCLIYAAAFGTAAALSLWFGANLIGTRWVGDARSVLSLRVLALSLPAFALSAVLAGYFTAVCRVVKSAAVQVAEQLIRIGVIVAALSLSRGFTTETACAVIVAGGVAGEASSFIMLYVLYAFDRRRHLPRKAAPEPGVTRRMFAIATPLALSAYARTALSTLQNLLVPRGFRKSGASAERALADYGSIQGMVFPVLMFPSAFFTSLAELLVPELTEAQVRGDTARISELAGRTLRMALLFSVGVAAILFACADELGMAIYKDSDVGRNIRVLAPLLPIMYLDSVTDGMLRGLGQQMYSMKYNILDSAISVALVYMLLPRYAITGYLFMICFTEVFNFALSIGRLRKLTRLRVPLQTIARAVLCAVVAVTLTAAGMGMARAPLQTEVGSLVVFITLAAVLYCALLPLLGCLDKSELRRVSQIAGEIRRAAGKFFAALFRGGYGIRKKDRNRD